MASSGTTQIGGYGVPLPEMPFGTHSIGPLWRPMRHWGSNNGAKLYEQHVLNGLVC